MLTTNMMLIQTHKAHIYYKQSYYTYCPYTLCIYVLICASIHRSKHMNNFIIKIDANIQLIKFIPISEFRKETSDAHALC